MMSGHAADETVGMEPARHAHTPSARTETGEPNGAGPTGAEPPEPESTGAELNGAGSVAAESGRAGHRVTGPDQGEPSLTEPELTGAKLTEPDRGEAAGGEPGLGEAGVGAAGGESGGAEPFAQAISRARRAARQVRSEAASEAHRQALVLDFFAQPVRDYVHQSLGRPVAVLRAGCVTPLAELGLELLHQDGYELSVVTVDASHGRRARIETGAETTVGDLRTIPLPPRSFDVVHCSLLLDRISHVPLVLDRFAAALRPGGLLLLRIRDRDTAAGFLDRRLPGWARRMLWVRLYPGQPGPFPSVYEPTGSGRGVAAYMMMRGLVITQRRTARTLPHRPERLCRILSVTRGLIARLSRGRLTDAHDEMLFVIRKPEDRFARVVLTPRRPGGVPARD
jgi:SAM-dependent methyltransferase